MSDQIIICPICKKGALVQDWNDRDYISCVNCGHRVVIR